MSVKPTIRNAVQIRTGVHDTYSSPVWIRVRGMNLVDGLGLSDAIRREVGLTLNLRRG